MLKYRWLGLLCATTLIAVVFSSCKSMRVKIPINSNEQITMGYDEGDFQIWVPLGEEHITLDSGNQYTYFPYDGESDIHISVGGLNLYNASRKQLCEALTDEAPEYTASAPISTSQQAAICGATVLELAYEEWTQANLLALDYNEDTGVWLIHGLQEDRTSPVIPLGVVALDASTGEIIAIGLMHTDCN